MKNKKKVILIIINYYKNKRNKYVKTSEMKKNGNKNLAKYV